MSPPDVYLTVTSGFFSVKPSITAWKDSPSAPVQTPITEIVAGDRLAARFLGRVPRVRGLVVVASTAPRGTGVRLSSSASSVKRRFVIPVLLLFRFRRRYRVPFPDRRSAKRACRRRSWTRSPLVAFERAPKRPTIVVAAPSSCAGEPRPSSVPASSCSSRTSSVIAGVASMEKCTITSEPSASVSSTSPFERSLGRRVGGERRRPRDLPAGCRGSRRGRRSS